MDGNSPRAAILEALKEGTILEKKRAGRVISYANPRLE